MSEFTIKDSLVSFKSPAVTDVTSAKVYFEPVQEGTGDPSPDNVRPITGWTEATLYKTGKNLLDPSKLKNQAGWNIIQIKVIPNTLYTCSSSRSDATDTLGLSIYFRNTNAGGESSTNIVSASHPATVRSTSTGYVYLSQRIASGNKTFSDVWIQVEVGTEATAYEPYNNGSAIPSEYQEVEYIEGNAEYSIIDTGIKGNSDSLIISGKTRYSAWYRYSPFYGNYLDEAYNVTRFITYIANDGRMIANVNRRASSSDVISCGFTPETDHVFTVSKTNAIIDDVSYAYSGYTSGTENATNIAINASRVNATPTKNTSKIRWYWFKIQNGDALLRNFIPCYRKSDNKPGMYDTVTNQFFASSGTEEFIAGPNIYYDAIPVSWETEAGTVYGGYVDLARGEVVATHMYATVSDNQFTYVNTGTVPAVYIRFDTNTYGRANADSSTNCITNMYPSGKGSLTDKYCVYYETEIDIYDSNFVDQETALSILQSFVCVYKLKQPTTYQLTPQTLQTLKGINNIWGNTNSDTEITYKVADALKMTQIRKNILMSQPHVETVTSEGIASFKTDVPALVKDCKVYFTPAQEGTGDPSPDNVRPITGWDGVTVYKTGKNLFDKAHMNSISGGYFDANNKIVSSSGRRIVWIPCKPNTTYKLSRIRLLSNERFYAGITYDTPRVGVYAYSLVHSTNSDTIGNEMAMTVNTDANAKYLVVWAYWDNRDDALDSLQIEYGSEATEYEPYTGTSITIPFPQTIYGGYVDLVKGEVVTEKVLLTMNGSETAWETYGQGNYPGFRYLLANAKIDGVPSQQIKSNWLTASSLRGNRGNTNQYTIYTYSGTTGYDAKYIFVCNVGTTDLTEFKAMLAESPLQICYPLSTPITYQLTPETIKTLRGINNIWSNANGNIEIKYWGH